MGEAAEANGLLPIVPFLKIPADGEPYLTGSKCGACGEVFVGDRQWCGRCAARDRMSEVRLSNRGHLHTFTIVHRSFPGIVVPFVSAIVDLEGGGSLKGNLTNVAPDLDAIEFGMPVTVVFEPVDRKDKEGNSYLSYFFSANTESQGKTQ